MRNDQLPNENNNIASKESSRFEKIRSFFVSNLRGLLSPPYLPSSLIIFIAFVVFTEACFTLMNQPIHYWVDHSYATGFLPVKMALSISPLLYIGLYVVYLLIVVFILGILNRRVSLVFWIIICTIHLVNATTIMRCGWDRLITFNGTTCDAFQFGTTVIGAAITGIVLSMSLYTITLGTQRPETQITKRNGFRMMLLAFWPLILIAGVITSTTIPGKGWKPLSTAHSPKARSGAAIAYDAKRDRAVLFGGASAWTGKDYIYENDTWIWDGKDWSKVATQIFPPTRSGHAMAYDEKRDEIVLFGGINQSGALGDTWVFDGTEWHDYGDSSCGCGPTARAYHQMFYDPTRGEVVLYGGYDLTKTFYNDAWAWDGSKWNQIYFDSASPMASGFNLLYDYARSQAFGHLSGYIGGTWILKGLDWEKLELPVEPSNRTGAGMVYDPSTKKVILYGGSNSSNTPLDDTWAYDGKGWSKMNLPSTLGGRVGASMFFDRTLNRVLLFGGYKSGVYYNDTSELIYP